MASYDSIERSPIHISSPPTAASRNTRNILLLALAALVGGFFLFDLTQLRFGRGGGAMRTTNKISSRPHHHTEFLTMEMPSGVNLGSWLSLEDYFFAAGAAVEVATPFNKTVASCLPPLHTGASTGPRWDSETDLLQSLTSQTTLAHALRVFHAFRVAFIDWEDDLATLASLGVEHVRVPLSWCLTDEDPNTIDDKEDDSLLAKKFTCEDPFYDGVRWPAGKPLCISCTLTKYRKYSSYHLVSATRFHRWLFKGMCRTWHWGYIGYSYLPWSNVDWYFFRPLAAMAEVLDAWRQTRNS